MQAHPADVFCLANHNPKANARRVQFPHVTNSAASQIRQRPRILLVVWKIAEMKYADLVRLVEADGWRLVATRGSHRQYKHPQKPGKVTIAGKPSVDVPPKTLSSVLKQAGLK